MRLIPSIVTSDPNLAAYRDGRRLSIKFAVATTANNPRIGPIKRIGQFKCIATANPSWIILLAPVLFLVHILEEVPGFMHWLNSITSPPVSEGGLFAANLPSLMITAVLAAATALFPRKGPGVALLFWLSYCMFANTLFHVTATVVLRRYCPGLITAVALYLPYYFWFAKYARSRLQVPAGVVAVAAVLASLSVYVQWHKVIFAAASR
jgi:Protein of unknown function with HXXEE motif